MVNGKHAKLELFDENENHKPILSSRQVYTTSTDVETMSNKIHQAVLHHQVQVTKQQQKYWHSRLHQPRKILSPNQGQWIETNAIFAGAFSICTWIKN